MIRGANLKADPTLIVRAHWSTYTNASTGGRYWPDYVLAVVPSAAVLTICLVFDVELDTTATAALLTVSGLLGAFLFGVMLQIYERAYELEDAKPIPDEALSTQVANLEELAANAAYAALVCIVTAGTFAVASATSGWWLRGFIAAGLALTAHYGIVLIMVMRRLFLRTQASLLRARTGAGRSRRAA